MQCVSITSVSRIVNRMICISQRVLSRSYRYSPTDRPTDRQQEFQIGKARVRGIACDFFALIVSSVHYDVYNMCAGGAARVARGRHARERHVCRDSCSSDGVASRRCNV